MKLEIEIFFVYENENDGQKWVILIFYAWLEFLRFFRNLKSNLNEIMTNKLKKFYDDEISDWLEFYVFYFLIEVGVMRFEINKILASRRWCIF